MDCDTTQIMDQSYMETRLALIKNKIIYLYGAGSFGKEMCSFLQKNGIEISGFLDQRAAQIKKYCGKPVYTLDSLDLSKGSNTLVLFSIVMDKTEREQLIRNIQDAGFPWVEEAQFYRSLQIIPDDLERGSLEEYFLERRDRIAHAYQALQDEKSKRIYEANIKAHFQKDFSGCTMWEDPLKKQYFPDDLRLACGYLRFVDCGGFVGDTIENLLQNRDTVEAIAVFEPDLINFSRLTHLFQKRTKEIIAFPCAVSNQTRFQKFSAASGSGSICPDGETTVLSVSLDETLLGFRPTFIKMDIEGAELDALCGAKKIIYRNTPDLAICVYHRINHLWDVILLLQSWNLGYQFYLRNYNSHTTAGWPFLVLYRRRRSINLQKPRLFSAWSTGSTVP